MIVGRLLIVRDVLTVLAEEELLIEVTDVSVVVMVCVDTVVTPVFTAGALVLMRGFLCNS